MHVSLAQINQQKESYESFISFLREEMRENELLTPTEGHFRSTIKKHLLKNAVQTSEALRAAK